MTFALHCHDVHKRYRARTGDAPGACAAIRELRTLDAGSKYLARAVPSCQ